ncbi:MAG: proton-conducting transporter membrane subunit [Candidatus Micrarchaeota archaeon]
MRRALPLAVFFIALAAMYLILANGMELAPEFRIAFSVACILGITIFSFIGLFDKSFMKYVLFSTIIQFFYFLLDVSTALLIEKSVWFAVLQLINFAVAGGLFAITMAILYGGLRKDGVRDYAGIYESNQYLALLLCIACLSLGGMPGFNVFIGEFIIYSSLFTVHPALMLGTVFASLVAFLFYFRICYVLFAGKGKKPISFGIIPNALSTALAIFTVVLGIAPQILFTILEMYT